MRRLRALLLAAGATVGARVAAEQAADHRMLRAELWERTNHRGEPVSLLEGPAVGAGLLVGGLAGATPRARAAIVLATAGGATFGLVDDLTEDTSTRRRGLRGHLGALLRGEVTTGSLKVLGIGATSVLAATVARTSTPRGRMARAADVVASGALIAVSANLVNLLDLRPGRALKAAGLLAAPVALTRTQGAGAAAAVLGAAGAALPNDLAERDMLGDGGANAVGALLGTSVVLAAPRWLRLAALGGGLALTLLSERVSFTHVIERTPVLRAIDQWGRRPPAPARTSSPSGRGLHERVASAGGPRASDRSDGAG